MPQPYRQAIVARLASMAREKKPIIGGGAGTGLSAKCEEMGGVDLIVIYNSGRYRMAGRGSAAGLLAFGNANEIVKEMAREVLPVVKRISGARRGQRHGSFRADAAIPGGAEGDGFRRACKTSRPSACSTGSCGPASRRPASASVSKSR